MAKHEEKIISIKNTDRIISFSDGVFAVAITLLVLQLPIPIKALGKDIGADLLKTIPFFTAYIISFIVIAQYWLKHLSFNNYIKRYTTSLVWLNFFYLIFLTFIPYPTAVYSTHSTRLIPTVLYAGNIAIVGFISYFMWLYLIKHPELKSEDTNMDKIRRASYVSLVMPVAFSISIAIAFIYLPLVVWVWVLLGASGQLIRRLL